MSIINIVDGQTDEILDDITAQFIISNIHKQSLKDNLETFDFRTFADKEFSQHLGKHNRVIIPSEDVGYTEFVIWESTKYRDSEGLKYEVYSSASYLLLKKAAIIKPQIFTEQTASMLAGRALNGTEYQVGIVEGKGHRTMRIEEHTNPYAFLRRIAKEFELELNFRVETKGGRVVGRYVDLLERVGQWRGREVEFGKDLIGIRRTEKTDNVYTALLGLGPTREDGTRLEVFVEDEDALQRWGRPDRNGKLQHLLEVYEPESTRENMTLEELTQYTRTELNKRINAVVEYETTIADLEHVPGMENKKIRFGDTIKIKDLKFNPPLYLEARIHTQDRDIIDKSNKHVELGDFTEYTEAEVKATWQSMQEEIRKRLARMVLCTIDSSAGDVFKNGIGSTDLFATVFLNGEEVDVDGTFYTYYWKKIDKRGIPVSGWNRTGKEITITADEIDEKATYAVDIILDTVMTIARITISNVFDGEDGQSLYTWIKYATTPTTGMSDNPDNKEYMGLAYDKETPVMSTNYADYKWAKFRGPGGVPGNPGDDGTPRYTWIKYADDKDGSEMSDNPDGKRWLGMAYNKTTIVESINPADYTWSPLYDNVVVGGVNLVQGTQSNGWMAYANATASIIDDAGGKIIRAVARASGIFGIMQSLEYRKMELVEGEEYMFSFDVRGNVSSINYLYLMHVPSPNQSVSPYPQVTSETEFHRVSVPFKKLRDSPISYPMISVNGGVAGDWFEVRNIQIEKGNIDTDYDKAPEDTDQAIEDVKEYATEVSEAAYIDAVNDAEAYLAANGVLKDTSYNGVSITNQEGFLTVRGDELVRTLQNATSGILIQNRASKTAAWKNVFYVDTKGKLHVIDAEISGHLNGATGSFSGDVSGATGTFGDVTVRDGDFTLEDDTTNVAYSVTPKRNLIKDHSFELIRQDGDSLSPDSLKYNWLEMLPNSLYADSPWFKTGSPKVAIPFAYDINDALAPFGDKAIVVRNSHYVSQYVHDGIGGNSFYTVSGFFKRQWNVVGGGIPRIEIWHTRTGSRLSKIVNSTFDAVKNDYSLARHATTFKTPTNYEEGDELEIIISGGNTSWIQCDGVQMVEGDRPSVYQPEDSVWDITNGHYRPISKQHMLAGGAMYPRETQTMTPEKPLTECMNGWIIQWQAYTPGTGIVNSNFEYTHIPKSHVNNAGTGVRVLLGTSGGAAFSKYIYIYNDRIVGHAGNDQSGSNSRVMTGVYEY